MLAMEQPLLCFSPCQNKNTTKNLFTALSFQRLPKVRFLVRRERSPKSKFLRNSIIVSIAPTTTVLLFPPHRTQNPLSKTHTLLCPAISKAKKKSFCPLSDADFFCKEKGFPQFLGFTLYTSTCIKKLLST